MVKVHEIENPIAIDKIILRAQKLLSKKLNWENVEIYGRIFRRAEKGKILPHAFIPSKGEYTFDVLTKEKGEAKIFFIPPTVEKELAGGQMEADIKIVFMVDLEKLYPDNDHRSDLEVRSLCREIISKDPSLRNIQKIESDMKEILKGFDYINPIHDAHPNHIFAIVSRVKYFLKSNCK
jgi:hypothetical protein